MRIAKLACTLSALAVLLSCGGVANPPLPTGSSTEIRKGVAVAIGQTVTLDFQLKVSEVATAIEASKSRIYHETEMKLDLLTSSLVILAIP